MSKAKEMTDIIARGESAVFFVGEHDGEPERRLKDELCRYFAANGSVKQAYLVVVRFGGEQTSNVALALSAQSGTQRELVEGIQELFRSIFNVSQHLDIIFVSAAQEAKIVPVCRPFYGASPC